MKYIWFSSSFRGTMFGLILPSRNNLCFLLGLMRYSAYNLNAVLVHEFFPYRFVAEMSSEQFFLGLALDLNLAPIRDEGLTFLNEMSLRFLSSSPSKPSQKKLSEKSRLYNTFHSSTFTSEFLPNKFFEVSNKMSVKFMIILLYISFS